MVPYDCCAFNIKIYSFVLLSHQCLFLKYSRLKKHLPSEFDILATF
jgi:hypothetical protein